MDEFRAAIAVERETWVKERNLVGSDDPVYRQHLNGVIVGLGMALNIVDGRRAQDFTNSNSDSRNDA